MSLASFVASQRADHGVPHAVACRALGVSESWFYKWRDRPVSEAQQRRAALDGEVKRIFEDSGGNPCTYGSPRIHAELRDLGWIVSEKTGAASMARQGLVARPKRRFRCLTRQDKRKVPFADLVGRDFTAGAPNLKWCGDIKCRCRHLMSYADCWTMPMLFTILLVVGRTEVQEIGIVPAS